MIKSEKQQQNSKRRLEFENQHSRLINLLEYEQSNDTMINVRKWENVIEKDEKELEHLKVNILLLMNRKL